MGCCCSKEDKIDCKHDIDLTKTHFSNCSFDPDSMRINTFDSQYIASRHEHEKESFTDRSLVQERVRGSSYLNSMELYRVQEFATTIFASPVKVPNEKKRKSVRLTDSPNRKKQGRNNDRLIVLKTLTTNGSGEIETLNKKVGLSAATFNLSPKRKSCATENLNLSPRKRALKTLNKKTVIFLVYPSGTNKDDVVHGVFKDYGFEKISVGSLLREYGVKHPEHGTEILKYVFKKKDVSSNIVVSLIQEKINSSESQRFIISGFPKNEENSLSWRQKIGFQIDVAALVMLTYTRKEYEFELNERAKKDGCKRLPFKEAMKKFDYFLTQTNKVADYYGESRCIRVSAKLEDHVISSQLLKHELITNILW